MELLVCTSHFSRVDNSDATEKTLARRELIFFVSWLVGKWALPHNHSNKTYKATGVSVESCSVHGSK